MYWTRIYNIKSRYNWEKVDITERKADKAKEIK